MTLSMVAFSCVGLICLASVGTNASNRQCSKLLKSGISTTPKHGCAVNDNCVIKQWFQEMKKRSPESVPVTNFWGSAFEAVR